MIVEVAGAGFGNKGAELMLRTVVKRLRSEDPETRIAVEPSLDLRFADRARLGVESIYPSVQQFSGKLRSLALRSTPLRKLMLAGVRTMRPRLAEATHGLIDRTACDAYLDIAGYAYGDKFPPLRTRIAAEAAAEHRRRGNPIVLFPQMLGPFTKSESAKWFKRLFDSADLVYAREARSYELAREVVGDDPRLRQAPDITIASLPEAMDSFPSSGARYVCVVPNERMNDQGRKEWGDTYLTRLEAVLRLALDRGYGACLVVHSSDPGDREMAEQLRKTVGEDRVTIFDSYDPFELKRFLGGAQLVVGSRFHSLVSALSLGTPVVALGWAHKYAMLMEEFGVPELLHRAADSVDQLQETVAELLDEGRSTVKRETIRQRGESLRGEIELMWREVFGLLESRKS